MDFQTAETESEFHDKFSLTGCKYFNDDMTLTFQLGCKGKNRFLKLIVHFMISLIL